MPTPRPPYFQKEYHIKNADAAAPRIAPARTDLMVEDSDRAAVDSLIIALLENIARDKHVANTRGHIGRGGPLAQEWYWNVCADEADALDIESHIPVPAISRSGHLPPRRSMTAQAQTRGTIVVAEDDEVTRMLLDRVLTRAGFTVHACENGRLACDAVRRIGADVVLLDWMMPVMDGPAAVTCLKANLDTREIPVVMLTTQSDIGERVVAFRSGVQDFMTKPFDRRELVARIERQVRRGREPAFDAHSPPIPLKFTRSGPRRHASSLDASG